MANVKNIVEKIGNKDKDYNLCVSRVNEKEITVSILREQIKRLNAEYVQLKNEASVDANEENKKHNEETGTYDKDEQELIAKEQELGAELEEIANKNEHVELIYEKVIENIKYFISKSNQLKNEEDRSDDKPEKDLKTEPEILKQYGKFLKLLKANVDNSYSQMSKERFLQLMKEKAKGNLQIEKKAVSGNKTLQLKHSLVNKKHKTTRDEDDSDENNVEDIVDQECNEELVHVLRGQQRAAAAEKLRQEREKELEKKK